MISSKAMEYILGSSSLLLAVIIIYLMILLKQKQDEIIEKDTVIQGIKDKYLEIKNENALLKQKNIFIEQQGNRMIDQFKSLSHETVASQSFSFIKIIEDHIHKMKSTNQEENQKYKSSMKEILLPMENTIQNFEKIMASFDSKTSVDNREIFSKLSQMVNSSHNLQQEVNKVINSLRSPNVKGIWGEMQLKKLVQLCGMEEHCDFQWQSTIENGMKPDMIINLPNDKQIIVDSKVSLSAYINCMDTNDDEKKKYYQQEHARQIKSHINSLYNKKYWDMLDNSPNFVVLFLPGECFLSAALEVNPSMLEYAAKYNIILATPTTMIGLLKTLAYGWENIHITKDINKIKNIIQSLHQDLSSIINEMENMGKIIQSLNSVYKNTSDTVKYNISNTLDEIQNKYFPTLQNNIKEEKNKKIKVPEAIKEELKRNSNNILNDDNNQEDHSIINSNAKQSEEKISAIIHNETIIVQENIVKEDNVFHNPPIFYVSKEIFQLTEEIYKKNPSLNDDKNIHNSHNNTIFHHNHSQILLMNYKIWLSGNMKNCYTIENICLIVH